MAKVVNKVGTGWVKTLEQIMDEAKEISETTESEEIRKLAKMIEDLAEYTMVRDDL